VIEEREVEVEGGRLHVYDTGAESDDGLVVVWHHGTPNLGEPPAPLLPAAERLGVRFVSYDRPGYGGSTPRPGRDAAAGAGEVTAIADALNLGDFAVMGHSGGGVYALACAALLPERVLALVCASTPAPFGAEGLDWYAGMAPAGEAELRAAAGGRDALERRFATAGFDPETFTPADHAALAGPWSWLGRIAGAALEGGIGGMVDDDLALVAPWGFDPGQVRAPTLVLHGGGDRMIPTAHGEWLARRIPSAELWLRPEDGHVSVLSSAEAALAWLREHATSG
jgi:pimeloyl-ACP methyl ester carboxylesterase